MNKHLLALAVTGLTTAGTSVAAPYAPFDVRSAGMGGTGVASAKAASAALFNPAMLSAQVEGDRFQFVLGAGATAADENKMFDQVDELQTTLTSIENLVDTYFDVSSLTPTLPISIGVTNAPGSLEYQVLTRTSNLTTQLAGQLNKIDDDSLVAGLGTGLGFGVPGKKIGIGFFVSGTGNAVATPLISPADTLLLTRYANILSDGTISALEAAANIDILNEFSGGQAVVNDVVPQSSVNGLAVAVVEYGVGFSHNYDLASGAQLSVGITPKAVNVATYDYTLDVENFQDSEIDTQEKTEDIFDVDLGMVYKASAASEWQFALVAKHVIGGEFVTSPNLAGGQAPKRIELAPQIRAGAARMTNRTTLAVDLDLVENDGVMPGTGTQFLALGAEYDLKYLQLRGGYRANLASSDVGDVLTVGLGLGPVDISAVASDESLGAYLQLGFGW